MAIRLSILLTAVGSLLLISTLQPQRSGIAAPTVAEKALTVAQMLADEERPSSHATAPKEEESALPEEETAPPKEEAEEAAAPETKEETRSTTLLAWSIPPLSSSDAPTATGHPDSTIGVYLTGNSIARSDGFFEQTLDAIMNVPGAAIVIDVKESYVYFDTTSEIAQELHLVREKYDLIEIIKKAKEKGIYTIARYVVAKDENLASLRPDTHIRHPETQRSVGSLWVDPSNATVLEYNEQVLRDVIIAGVDEINLDYIRYPTEYAPSLIGLTGDEKADHVEAFLKMVRENIDELSPETKLGISTYAILGWDFAINFERLGQDIARFAPLVDIISPMAYPASFTNGYYFNPYEDPRSRMYFLVYRTLTGYQDLLGEDSWKLRPWIQGYRVTPWDMREQMDAVYDAGLCGFTVWSPSNIYRSLYSVLEDFSIPEHCRETQKIVRSD